MYTYGLAYLLWLGGFFGLCGLHRFYVGKPFSALLWLFTLGLLGLGQLIDLILIPGLVDQANRRAAASLTVHVHQRPGRPARLDE
jgi:TM2 domain-containing membrane protein YozV